MRRYTYRGRGSIADTPMAVLRMVILLVTHAWGWMLIGILVFIGSLIWGLTSHQVSYIQRGQEPYQVFLSDDNGFLYFQQVGTSNYYVMHISDYTPFADTATILNTMHASGRITFIASTDSTKADIELNGTLVYTAHPIEKITFTDRNGQNAVTYTSAEYSGNPNGYTVNNWPYASLLMLAGALCAGIALFFTIRARQRHKLAVAAELAALHTRPSPFARELAQDATQFSQQPYQGVGQYPQTMPTTQISTPYRQPQE